MTERDEITEADFEQVLKAVVDAINLPMTMLIIATGDRKLINDRNDLIKGVALSAIDATAQQMADITERLAT